MLVFHSYHDAILQKYIFELTLFYSKKQTKTGKKKQNKNKQYNIKTKTKQKQISKTNHCQTMDYRNQPTNYTQACEMLMHIRTNLQFLKRVKSPIVQGILHSMTYHRV
jgi:hypothetical protein